MTGQYGPRTGVTQTDGLFKSGDARNFPWLRADGTPTIGDWFKALGYTTHYFGKWHVSDPPEHTLRGFGFGDWELSWPEPHGSLLNNLGTFRDYQFADLACTFLRNRGLGVPYARATSALAGSDPDSTAQPQTQPFFAVCSFTNPHDIATYAALPRFLTTPPAGPRPEQVGPDPAAGRPQPATAARQLLCAAQRGRVSTRLRLGLALAGRGTKDQQQAARAVRLCDQARPRARGQDRARGRGQR
jgi:arylsulfatase A-like enzyme